jgi:hypothetical protein
VIESLVVRAVVSFAAQSDTMTPALAEKELRRRSFRRVQACP